MKKKVTALFLCGLLAIQGAAPALAEEMETPAKTSEEIVWQQEEQPQAEEAASELKTLTEAAETQTENSETAETETEAEASPAPAADEEIILQSESTVDSFVLPEEEVILGEPVPETDAFEAIPQESAAGPDSLIGVWTGTYGQQFSELRFSIDACTEDGYLSGTALVNSGENGMFSFDGFADFETGAILLTQTEWISNPDNMMFGSFSGMLDTQNGIISGMTGENTEEPLILQKISQDAMPAIMLAQSTEDLPDYDIWMANTMIYGYDHNGNGLYQTFQSLADPVYKELGGYLLGDAPLMYMSSAWSVFLNSEYRNQFANEQKYIYEVLLMAYLKYDSKSQSASSVLDNGLMKNAMKLYSMLTNDIIENRSEYVNGMTVEDAVKFYENTDILKKMNIAMSELQAGISSVKGLINTLSEYMTLQQAKEQRVALLKIAKDACASSDYRNDDFISAADELINMVEGSPLIYVQNKSADYLWGEMCDYAWGKLCDANPVLKTIETGVKGLDRCFDSSNAASNNLKLAVLYTVDNYLKLGMMQAASNFMDNGSTENGSAFLACFQGYMQFQMYGNDFAKTWLNGYLNSGIISNYVNMIFYRENMKTAQELINHSESQTANRKKLLQLMDRSSQIYKNLYMTPDMKKTLYDDHVPVTGVSFSKSSDFLQNKNSIFLAYANVQPENATNKNIIYSSSNPAILSVPKNGGFVTIYGSGTVTITAKTEDGGYTATQTLTIGDSVARKKLDGGKCGPDASWQLLDDGELYISGSGEMYSYSSYANPWYENQIIKATVSDGITSIGEYAFDHCDDLTSIALPKGLTSIGQKAFSGCDSLTNIELPKGLTSVGQEAFEDCYGLTSIKFLEGLTSIGAFAFEDCYGLTSIELPEGLTSIGSHAFWSCDSLTSIELPKGLTSIEAGTFLGCDGLISVEFPEGFTSIGGRAFASCNSLTCVKFLEGLTSIGDYAFDDCYSLTSIELPKGLTSIGECTFSDCKNLTDIKLPEGLTSIGDCAFLRCSNLTSIELPESLTSIGVRAFSGCAAGFTILGIKGSYAEKYAAEYGITFKEKCKSHTYQTVITEQPTCAKTGKSVERCTKCGEIKSGSEKVIPKTAHKFGAYKVTTEPTVFKTGTQAASCTVCGAKQTKTLAKLKADVKLTKTELILEVEKTASLTSYVTGLKKGDSVETWKSSDTKVATVDKNGKVTAKASGTATITVTTAAKASAKLTLTVKQPAVKTTAITGLKKSVSLAVGKTGTLKPVLTPANSTEKITYKSSNTKIATVSSTGVVKGVKAGTAKIRVKSGSKSFIVTVTVVTAKTTAITGLKKNVSLTVGRTGTLKPVLTPANSTEKITYKSSNTKIATVSSKGVVKGVKAGTAKIRVKSGSKSFIVTVTVVNPAPKALTNVPKTAIIKKGKTYTLDPKFSPAGSSGTLKYKSSNTKVATVSSKGVITGKKKGKAIITVYVGKITATCKVKVK